MHLLYTKDEHSVGNLNETLSGNLSMNSYFNQRAIVIIHNNNKYTTYLRKQPNIPALYNLFGSGTDPISQLIWLLLLLWLFK